MRKVEAFMKPWQVSKYLGIPIEEVYNMLKEGELPGTKIDERWRIRRTKLEKWLDEEASKEDLIKLSKRIKEVDEETIEDFIQKVEKPSEHGD